MKEHHTFRIDGEADVRLRLVTGDRVILEVADDRRDLTLNIDRLALDALTQTLARGADAADRSHARTRHPSLVGLPSTSR